MLEYLVASHARRELLKQLWAHETVGSVSTLSRRAGVTFSAAHRELQAMRRAGLALAERHGAELVYRAGTDHPQANVLRQLLRSPSADDSGHDEEHVRGWLSALGAPLASPAPKGRAPKAETVLADALALAHRDATVARTLPLVLWRQADHLDMDRLVQEATRRDERAALGLFLELAGRFGRDARLTVAATQLRDRRRTRLRPFFQRPQGAYETLLAERHTPAAVRRWGYLMNTGLDSFEALFEKFGRSS